MSDITPSHSATMRELEQTRAERDALAARLDAAERERDSSWVSYCRLLAERDALAAAIGDPEQMRDAAKGCHRIYPVIAEILRRIADAADPDNSSTDGPSFEDGV